MSEKQAVPGDTGGARARILDAARREIARTGWAVARSGRVAQQAGVSKALIHYHFKDKDALLLAVAVQCRDRVMSRGSHQARPTLHENPVDGFSEWLELELAAQDLRIALQLKTSGSSSVVRAAEAVLAAVRAEVQRQQDLVFQTLELAPAVPSESIVDLLMAMAEGEATAPTEPLARRRRMVETLWLSLLSVAD